VAQKQEIRDMWMLHTITWHKSENKEDVDVNKHNISDIIVADLRASGVGPPDMVWQLHSHHRLDEKLKKTSTGVSASK